MELPENLTEIVRQAAKKYGDNVDRAVDEAEEKIRRLPSFSSLVKTLVRRSIRKLVYDFRHETDVQMRKEAKTYGQPGKVNGVTPGVARAYQSVYGYFIAGKTLGEVKGAELEEIATKESAIASGYLFNARLCRELKKMVPEDRRVKDAVPEKKLRQLFKDLQEEED